MHSKKISKQNTNNNESVINVENIEFGGAHNALFLSLFGLFLPLILNIWCNNEYCSYKKFPNFENIQLMFKNAGGTPFACDIISIYLGLHIIHIILILIPYGGEIVDGPEIQVKNIREKVKIRTNGTFSLIVVLTIIFYLEYNHIYILDCLYRKQLQFIIFAIICGCIKSCVLFVGGARNTNQPWSLYKFVMGYENYPRYGGFIDEKLLTARVSFTIPILLLLSYLTHSFGVNSPVELTWNAITSHFNLTLFVACALQLMYLLKDPFLCEDNYMSSFEIQKETVGFMITIGYSTWSWWCSLIGKDIYEHNITRPWYLILAAIAVSILGLFVSYQSDRQKRLTRTDPTHPKVINLKSIKTPYGSKLLISGYWGLVRHPNYLGDILVHLSFSLFTLTSPSALVAFPFTAIFLYHRSLRDHERCQQKYGKIWDEYCRHVKYRVVPFIL